MGSSESTGRSNRTNEDEEEERQPENNNSGNGSGGSGTAIAVAAAGTAVALWGISRMLSSNTNTDRKEEDDAMAMKASGLTEANYFPNSYPYTHMVLEGNHGSTSEPSTWSPPPLGRFKMNTDGAARVIRQVPGHLNTGPSGYGGILRDHRGNWVRGFRGFIRESDVDTAEWLGILKGLELLQVPQYRGSVLESDREGTVNSINNEDRSYNGTDDFKKRRREMIEECRRLKNKNSIIVQHVPKTGNKCADKLANMGIYSEEEYVDIIDLPNEIKHLVNDDMINLL